MPFQLPDQLIEFCSKKESEVVRKGVWIVICWAEAADATMRVMAIPKSRMACRVRIIQYLLLQPCPLLLYRCRAGNTNPKCQFRNPKQTRSVGSVRSLFGFHQLHAPQ